MIVANLFLQGEKALLIWAESVLYIDSHSVKLKTLFMTWVTLSSFWRCSTLRLGPILLFTRLIISYLKKTNILDSVKLMVGPAWWGSRICGHPPPWEQSWSPGWSTHSPDEVLDEKPLSEYICCKPQEKKQDSSQSMTRAPGFDLLNGGLHCLEQK